MAEICNLGAFNVDELMETNLRLAFDDMDKVGLDGVKDDNGDTYRILSLIEQSKDTVQNLDV